jgi:hypothetical protein
VQRSTVTVSETGVRPAGVTARLVEVTCNNVTVNGAAAPSVTWTANFAAPNLIGSIDVPFQTTANTSCSYKLTTSGTATGGVTVLVNGVGRGTGINGSVQTPLVALGAPFAATFVIAY